MALSNDLMSQFAKLVTANTAKSDTKQETTVYGTVVEYEGAKHVRIDGSSFMTPIVTTADVAVGERVTVMIKNHLATVTGNISSPSARTDDVASIGKDTQDLSERVAEFEKIEAEIGKIGELETNTLNVKNRMTAAEAKIVSLEAEDVKINGVLVANAADIKTLKADDVDIKGRVSAAEGVIKSLDTTYANIDFSNIGKAAMEYLYANSGLIENVVVSNGTITGKLVGVTISGDLIEGNTIVAEKLVVKGSDGLYYKLNTDGMKIEAEQTDYNSLNGQVIKAQSITANKIAVDDLVAFDATIGGFNITEDSIYSGVKEAVDNTTRGIYLDNDGQIAFGDEDNYLRYYKAADGKYKLEISAESVIFKSSVSAGGGHASSDLSNAVAKTTVEEYYQSESPVLLAGSEWSEEAPTWIDGKYIWQRTKTTYGDGTIKYAPSEVGICITGNTGAKGDKGEDSILLMIESSNGNIFKNTGVATTLTVNVIVGDQRITSYRQLQERFGSGAYLTWSIKRQGETEFTELPPDDPRISDNGFILTLNPNDVNVKTVFDCSLNY